MPVTGEVPLPGNGHERSTMIPETFNRLRESDRAVSPVIGVILMVAITVIIAAVMAAFVLGFGADQEVAPQASWSVSYDSGENNVTFTHQGGDQVDGTQIDITGADGTFYAGNDSNLRAGDTIVFGVDSGAEGDEISLIWVADDGDTAILRTYTIPDN